MERTTKGTVFFINDQKYAVGTPFHNVDRGQKRYLKKSGKKTGHSFSFQHLFGLKNGQKKGGEIEDTKTVKKVLRIPWLVGRATFALYGAIPGWKEFGEDSPMPAFAAN